MLGRFLIYWGLALDAFLRGDPYPAAMCLVIPFIGVPGMVFAAVAGILFAYHGHWVEALVTWGYLVACLYGNRQSPAARSSVFAIDAGRGYWAKPDASVPAVPPVLPVPPPAKP